MTDENIKKLREIDKQLTELCAYSKLECKECPLVLEVGNEVYCLGIEFTNNLNELYPLDNE